MEKNCPNPEREICIQISTLDQDRRAQQNTAGYENPLAECQHPAIWAACVIHIAGLRMARPT